MQPNLSPASALAQNLLKLAIMAMGIVYLAGCFTPLHLHFDSIRYYNIKDCLQYGCPSDSFAATDYLPYGYTALLIVLSKIGLLSAFSITLINCLYVFAALYLIQKIFGQLVSPLLLVLVVLFNWVLIKFVTHPLSEMQYIFFSAVSLYFFHRFRQNKNFFLLGLSFLFCFLTVLTRTVGIALLPALFLGVAWEYKDELARIIRKNKIALVLLVLAGIGAVFFAKQLKILDYTSLLKGPLEKGVGNFIGENLSNHFTELSEVFLNLPSNKILPFLPSSIGTVLFIVLGVLFFAWIMFCTFSRKSQIPFYIKVYLLFYSIIILNWPYYDPRFWVPVLPLIVAVILRTPFHAYPLLKWVGRAYLVIYLVLGLFAAGYSLYVGFNKERFAEKHAKGVYRNEYETHFFGKPQSDTARSIDPNVVEILNKYD